MRKLELIARKLLCFFFIAIHRVGYYKTVSLTELVFRPEIGGGANGGSERQTILKFSEVIE